MTKSLVLVFFYLFFLIFFITFSFYRYNHYQIYYYDFGIFERIIYLMSIFKEPIIIQNDLGKVYFLADHFNPSLFLLSPLFWLIKSPKILLVEQSVFTLLNGIVIYLISRRFNLSFLNSLILSFIFLVFTGTLGPLVSDWHPETTAGFFLLSFFYFFYFTKKSFYYFLAAFIFLGFKESNGLTLSFLSFYLYTQKFPKYKKIHLIIITLFSLSWSFITIKFLIPLFAHSNYLYTPTLPKTFSQIVLTIKDLELFFKSLISFGFLPLINPVSLIPFIGEMVIRVLPLKSKFQTTTLGLHYNVYSGIFLALGSILALAKTAKLKKYLQVVSIAALLIAILTARKITSSSINLAVNKDFWTNLNPNLEVDRVVSQIPKEGSLMAPNNILSHLALRKEDIFLLSKNYASQKPSWIIIDTDPNQTPNNYWGPDGAISYSDLIKLERQISKDPNYKKIDVSRGGILVFQRFKK